MQIDGFLMLLCSLVVFASTGSLTYLGCVYTVIRTARNADTEIDETDTAVVMGVNLSAGGALKPDFMTRLDRASRGDVAELWVVGGYTSTDTNLSEAAAGRAWLIENGVDKEKVRIEESSRHTLENLSLLRERIGAATRRYALISNRYHLARVGMMASGLGMNYVLCAAEDRQAVPLRYWPKVAA